MQVIRKIALREEVGDLFAEGSVRVAAKIEKGAERYVMVTKGMEMMSHDPRASWRGWCFGDLTNPRGGDNLKGTHFLADQPTGPEWWVDKFDMFEEVKEKTFGIPWQEIGCTWKGKPMMCKWFEDLYSIQNAIGLCFFPSAMALAVSLTHFSKLFSAFTGWDTSPQDIMKLGERIFTVLKA